MYQRRSMSGAKIGKPKNFRKNGLRAAAIEGIF
jgi:hypothetical protein